MKYFLTLALLATIATTHADSLLVSSPETPAAKTARELVESIQASKRAMLGEFRHNVCLLWDSPNPQAALDVLGPKAAEVFALSNSYAEFLSGIMGAANDEAGLAELAAILSKIKPATIHADGTVTINAAQP